MKLAHRSKVISSLATVVTIASLFFPFSASAWTTGQNFDFGMCPTPGGQVVASYNDGYHWIAGESFLRWGSDKVYSKGNDNYTQCYCPEVVNTQTPDNTKPGIQSDWLKESNISPAMATALKSTGWIEENGADFGLTNEPYLVLNHLFVCSAICYPPQPKPTTYPKPTWYPTPTQHPSPTWYPPISPKIKH